MCQSVTVRQETHPPPKTISFLEFIRKRTLPTTEEGATKMRRKNLLLTGTPGVGKTTVIRKVLEALPKEIAVDGFFTEEVRERGERIGFQIVTFDGQREWLAHKGFPSPHRVGPYGVNVAAIAAILVPALERGLRQADLIVIDEIAKMELSHPAFAEAVWRCLESPKLVLGVLQKSRLPFLDRVRAREDIWLWEVTKGNRNHLPSQIVPVLLSLLRGQ